MPAASAGRQCRPHVVGAPLALDLQSRLAPPRPARSRLLARRDLLDSAARRALPRWLKLGYTAWFLVWVPVYWIDNGPANFLWLCDVANFVLLAAIWLESSLLISSQAVSVLLIQLAWIVDFGTRLVAGFHPIGGTEYMFESARPLFGRLLSLFHVFIPILLLYALWRLGARPPRLAPADLDLLAGAAAELLDRRAAGQPQLAVGAVWHASRPGCRRSPSWRSA